MHVRTRPSSQLAFANTTSGPEILNFQPQVLALGKGATQEEREHCVPEGTLSGTFQLESEGEVVEAGPIVSEKEHKEEAEEIKEEAAEVAEEEAGPAPGRQQGQGRLRRRRRLGPNRKDGLNGVAAPLRGHPVSNRQLPGDSAEKMSRESPEREPPTPGPPASEITRRSLLQRAAVLGLAGTTLGALDLLAPAPLRAAAAGLGAAAARSSSRSGITPRRR